MNSLEKEALYELLRIAVGANDVTHCLTHTLDAEQWLELHSVCLKQQIVAVVYHAICRLPKEQQPPLDIAFQWASEAETVRGQNNHLNAETTRLTELFTAQGCKTAVLKGPANARLYPEPAMRHAGDIDLWVEGGRKKILELLPKMGFAINPKDLLSEHHIHLNCKNRSVTVEIHYKPCSGNFNPFSTSRLLRFLDREIQDVELVPEGFYVPSMKFALTMQLAHIQKHFLKNGIGFKQILDYYILLKHSSVQDRCDVNAQLSSLGLLRSAGALMWVLERVWGLGESEMICAPDRKRGERMLDEIFNGANFGKYRKLERREVQVHFLVRWLKRKSRDFSLFWFAPSEIAWIFFDYLRSFLRSVPVRIKMRKLSLWDVFH